MKVIVASSLFSMATATSIMTAVRQPQTPWRRLDQNQEADYSFLQNYEQVFLKCLKGEKSQNKEDGSWEYSSVAYRLCPVGNSCDAKGKPCSEGYGDYIVGIETYTRAFFDQFERENGEQQNADDANDFDFMEMGECRELDFQADDGVQYYVGPGCTDAGDVKLTLYTDGYCRPAYEVTETSFEELTGFELPYSNGIHSMEDGACKAYYCNSQNENGEYEVNEFCQEAYENAGSKCEERMEYTSSYTGADVSGCEYISALLPKSASGGGGGMWFLFALLIAAVAGFGIWFFLSHKKKQNTAVNSDGLMM
jgi:hypothetical protein